MRTMVNLASAVLALIVAHSVLAQNYPDKPVRIIVPFPAGGITDFQLRWAAQKLSQSWGQPVVVDNRAGAGGTLGTDMVARAPKDGYTLLGGKVRDRIEVSADIGEAEARALALGSEKVQAQLGGAEPARVIVRAPALVNVVLR